MWNENIGQEWIDEFSKLKHTFHFRISITKNECAIKYVSKEHFIRIVYCYILVILYFWRQSFTKPLEKIVQLKLHFYNFEVESS